MRTFLILLIALLFTSEMNAQDIKARAVYFNGDYFSAPSVKKTLKVSQMNGYGGGVKVEFIIDDLFTAAISGSYSEMNINQEEHALFAEWNWNTWKRYYGDINDPNFATATQWVQSVLKDTNYKAGFLPVQKMDFFPVVLSFGCIIKPVNNLELIPSFGLGILFYMKRLYIEETWYKKFTQVPGYTYEYSYRNMNENISGSVLSAVTGMDISYRLGEIVTLRGSVSYHYIFENSGNSYYHFPAKDLLNLKAGISLLY